MRLELFMENAGKEHFPDSEGRPELLPTSEPRTSRRMSIPES